MSRGLVLAGGGVAGIAWELGVLLGVRDAVPDLAPALVDADVIIGTSAGSAVAAQITSGTDLAVLFSAQLSETTSEIEVDVDLHALITDLSEATLGASSQQQALQRIGALALGADTVTESARYRVIAARLPSHDWPARRLLVPAVDAATGELVTFTGTDAVGLVDAVAASCAVPGVWPPVTINGHRYIDGGMRSATNADLAAGCDRVLVITPTLADAPAPWGGLADEIDRLAPAEVLVVHADEATQAAFGSNPLSPSTRRPSANAGRTIGHTHAGEIARFWR